MAFAAAALAMALCAPASAHAETYTYSGTLSDSWVKIQDNVTDISRVTPISGVTAGGWINVHAVNAYFVRYSGNEMWCQMQLEVDYLKCVAVAFKVEGNQLFIRRKYVDYVATVPAGSFDFDTRGHVTAEYNMGSVTYEYDPLVETVPAAYQRLQYLKSSGTQYVDTRVPVKDTLSVQAKIQNAKNDASMYVMGARTAFQSNAIGLSF
ncbi:MAG: hypothetical protein MJ138_01505, partial [Kiritimatiellae bacterium]|nr:hypothetical protein [Kiritimatiellia bacterium]